MESKNGATTNSDTTYRPYGSVIILIIVTFLAPYLFRWYIDAFDQVAAYTLYAALWIYESYSFPNFMNWPWGLINDPIIIALRLLFVYQVFRYYRGVTSRNAAMFTGLLGEIWASTHLILDLLTFNISLRRGIVVAIPLLFFAGLILMVLIPPPKPPEHWLDDVDEVGGTRTRHIKSLWR
ncbi:MAG: hypothetical protein ACXABY_28140 [Candidatus Thorarchaeota archaeon]